MAYTSLDEARTTSDTTGHVADHNIVHKMVNALAEIHPLLWPKSSSDDPPDDEIDDTTGMSGSTNGLDSKWTAVLGSSGTVDMDGTAGDIYDLATAPGLLLLQADSEVELRQDWTIADGECIIACILPSLGFPDEQINANQAKFGIALNDTDTGPNDGNYVLLEFDANTDGWRILFYDGTTSKATGGTGATELADFSGMYYFRLDRVGSEIQAFVSRNGVNWSPFDGLTPGATPTNFWVYCTAVTPSGHLPIHAVKWVRKGTAGQVIPW